MPKVKVKGEGGIRLQGTIIGAVGDRLRQGVRGIIEDLGHHHMIDIEAEIITGTMIEKEDITIKNRKDQDLQLQKILWDQT